MTQNTDSPLVSIIIPCYNQGHYLGDAVKSALAQTFSNIEIVVVDDGSSDDTSRQARCFPEVNYIYQPNQGLSAARNSGTRASAGRYIVYLDADDRLLPHAVASNEGFLSAGPGFALVAGHYQYINSDGTIIHHNKYHGLSLEYYRHLLMDNFIGMHGACMYRREVIERIGGFDETLRACEDYDVYLKIARRHSIICHPSVLAEYRRHGSGISSKPDLMLQMAYEVLEREYAFVVSQKDTKLTTAYARGINTWRNRYGREMILKAIDAVSKGDFTTAKSQCIAVMPHVPGMVAWLGKRAIGRGFG